MYITKNITTSYGVAATHHKIIALHIYYDQGISHVDIGEYLSETACLDYAHTPAVTVEQIELNQTVFDNETEIYNAVLSSPIFIGGTLIQETN